MYSVLTQLSDEQQKCSSTRKDIQRASGVQRVSRHTQNLLRYGHIDIEKNGEGNRNIYRLLAGIKDTKSSQAETLNTFAKQYLEFSSGSHTRKTYKTYKTAFREFLRAEGDCNLHSIGIREIEHFLSVKKKEASECTSRKYYGTLRSAFKKAEQWELIKDNPFRKVKKPKPPEVSPVYFEDKDFQLLLSAVDDRDCRELYKIGLYTGLRLGELLSLRWSDVNFATKVILV